MSGRKKHRVIVEVTFDRNVTAKRARDTVLWGLDKDAMNDYAQLPPSSPEVTTVRVKEAERVIQAELRWRGKVKDESVRDIT